MEKQQHTKLAVAPSSLLDISVSMRGNGCYNRNAKIQKAAMVKALSLFPAACENCPFNERLHTVVDYGASEGINSISPLSHFLNSAAWDPAHPIDVQYFLVDTPANDFTSLARTMHSAMPAWAKDYPSARVFPLMIGRSFYQQIVPDRQVHFGFSFSCLQWLSQVPPADAAQNYPFVDRVLLMNSRQNTCRGQSDADLHQFLRVRGDEFVSGAPLILSFVGRSTTCAFWETPVFKCLLLALDEMVGSGLITLTTANLFYPPLFARDLQQVQAVLSSAEVNSTWSTVYLSEEDIEHPKSSKLARPGTSLEESTKYAEEMINFGFVILSEFLKEAIRAQVGPAFIRGKVATPVTGDILDAFDGAMCDWLMLRLREPGWPGSLPVIVALLASLITLCLTLSIDTGLDRRAGAESKTLLGIASRPPRCKEPGALLAHPLFGTALPLTTLGTTFYLRFMARVARTVSKYREKGASDNILDHAP
ncbi:SAM dependent carboxyl methyltransferase [Beauveria bassiana ARSEF 2860]|uniref:SAM dependent carboxyl methyltransferase n=1 Tax=Beauveria bassiana (strain ARSEF 2860) TaxID=655819 RepID=J4UFZ9_BEAB2|nr:SAM dependent carboxyl methyltransferase [Beauveria bassiana ARSEF 2860]EJP61617.1 SAM dependent carboxyl methyltransferase [Beauveria bassiana ARSEF 2860]